MLKCKKISKRFGEVAAVNSLSFSVEKGEIFGMAGPNGAGKTTVFNLITGICQGTGEIIFDGHNISSYPAHKICHKGMSRTFQIPQLFSSLSIYDNVRAGAHFGKTRVKNERKSISDAIDFVDLNEKSGLRAGSIKLWDKKMTMIASALATGPKMLLLDEPISGLNPKEIKQSIELFKKINIELGITIIIIEHFMKVLTELSERLMIIQNGEKVCIGSPHEVTKDKRVIEIYLGDSYADS